MRDPARKAAFWLAILAVGLGLLAYGYPRLETYAPSPPAAVIAMLGGFLLAVTGATLFLLAFLFARGRARLLAARDAGTLVARWTVGAADWGRFRAIDRARAAEHRELTNQLKLDRDPPPTGSEILVGETGLMVDGVYHDLLHGGGPALLAAGWLGPPADPECLELRLIAVTRFGSYRSALRVPVPAGSRAQGIRAYEHFAARAPKPRKPLNLRLAAIIAAISAIAGAAAFAIGWRMRQGGDPGWTPSAWMAWGMGGVLLALILALAALATHFRRR